MPSTHPRLRTLPGDLFRSLSSFADLERRIAALPEELMRGDALEVFVEGYLRTSTIWQVTELAIVGHVPADWLRELNLANNPTGIDGVFQSKDGGLVPYQVKFRTGRPQVGVAEVGTFLGLTERGARRVLISNSTRYAADVERRDRLRIVRGSDLDAITQEELRDISHWIYGKPVRPSRYSPRPHQVKAIADINAALAGHNRATCVMACATGKTLVALWAAEAQHPRTVLVLLPSLALLGQTLAEWSRHTNWGERFEYRCVCSDPTVAGNPDDSWQVRSTEAPFPIDTDAMGVRRFLSRPQSDAVRVVFSTYHSSPIVAEGLPAGTSFDVGVFDEAHQTTGAAASAFAFALRDENLPIAKRLFFTATPRHVDVHHRDRNDDFRVVSMDDVSVYGPRAHTLAFADAVAQGLICDYRIVISVVDPAELPPVALQRGITLVKGDDTHARWVARQVALQRAIADTGVSKVITFHSRVAHAQAFASDTPQGIHQFLDDFQVDHVNGTQPVASRLEVLRGFADECRRVVTNARCLTEGVDLPAVDMVAFCSPRRSEVDIVQAVGRAMRKPASGTKEFGYVFLPLLIQPHNGEDVEAAAANTDWCELIDVIAALREHDVRLHASLQAIQIARGEGLPFSPRDVLDRIDVIGPHVSLDAIRRSIASLLVEKLGEPWDFRYGELRNFREIAGHCNVPQKYAANPQLGLWVTAQRSRKRKGKLASERIQRLEALGFVWDQRDSAWEEMFMALAAFKEEHGHCNVPREANPQLETWVISQRSRRERMPAERVQRLEALGFSWAPRDHRWEGMYTALAAYKQEHGHCDVPAKYPLNQQLPTWIINQRRRKRRGELPAERIQRLDELGFLWEPFDSTFEEMFTALVAFKDEHGHCKVPQSYPPNQQLAKWVSHQRGAKARGTLASERVQRLHALGFVWDAINTAWEEMFMALVDFKEEHGHCNVPQKYAANPQLGSWVTNQRHRSSRGAVASERIERLNALGFVWSTPRSSPRFTWDEMLAALVAFKEEHGHCNVPQDYAENQQLGSWVTTQRSRKRRGTLATDRIQRLEALGFGWDPRDAKWEPMFAALSAFKEEHGHCNVPRKANPQLATWVRSQRRRREGMPAERVRRLEALEFVWDTRRA